MHYKIRGIGYKKPAGGFSVAENDAPYDGYYFVNSYDNTALDFIPPNPAKEGCIFGGWYKEL